MSHLPWSTSRRFVQLVILLAVFSGSVLSIVWFWAGQPTVTFRQPVTFTRSRSARTSLSTMPVVIQLTASQAEHRLAAQGVHSDQITIRRASVGSDGQPKQYPSGWVIAESPTVGTPLTTSTKIGLMVAP